MELDDLENKIKEVLAKYALDAKKDNIKSNVDWTANLKKALGFLSHELNFKVCTSGFKELGFEAEWLYDLVWYSEDGNGDKARLIDIPLVVESEWSIHFKDIKYDFEKLLLANASHRLMTCYAKPEDNYKLLDYFHDAIKSYQLNRTGDRYMIAILNAETNDRFHFHLFTKT